MKPGQPEVTTPLAGDSASVAPASVSQPSPLIPDHELLRRIGGGSYGEVWLARNALGAYRAVKIVRRASFEHERPFEREFNGIQRFEPISRQHEGLVDLLQVGRNDAEGYFYYVMELADDANVEGNARPHPGPLHQGEGGTSSTRRQVEALQNFDRRLAAVPSPGGEGQGEGGPTSQLSTLDPVNYSAKTLRSEIQGHGRLPLDECITVGFALTRALAYLHGQGLVHRDIKPSNIIFVGGVPKLADVGLVSGAGEARSYVGTEGFIPPEGPGSPQADLYGLGIVLYVMSTGKSHQDFPEPLPDLAAQPDHARWLEFNAVIHKACAAEVHKRYQNAEEMHNELALLQHGQSVKRTRTIQRRLAAVTKFSLVAAVIALVVFGGVFLRRSITQNRPAAEPQLAENPEVTMLCKLGRINYYRLTEGGYAKAMKCFNQALEIDPKSISAYAAIADLSFGCQPSEFLAPKAAEAKMRWARDKIIALDSLRAEGHAVQGFIHLVYDWNPDEAEKELNLALERDPELVIARIWQGRYLLYTGKFEEAEREFKKARQLEPICYGLNVYVGIPSFFARDYDRAIEYFETASEVPLGTGWATWLIGRANEEKGNYPAAIETFQKAGLIKGEQPEVLKQRSEEMRAACEASGSEGYWRRQLEFALNDYSGWNAWIGALEIARIYARMRYADKAFEWLDKAFQEKSEYLLWLNVDPGWDNIRSDPRFIALLKRMGLAK